MAQSGRQEPEQVRSALLDQLGYLIEEIETVKAIIGRVPVAVQEFRPWTGDLSVKETYGLLATMDEEVFLPRLERILAEDEPAFEEVDEETLAEEARWNEEPLEAILDRVQQARRRLLAFLEGVPLKAWVRTGRVGERRRNVFELAYDITQHDADLLRTVGYRLHESHLTDRPGDLPK